jgi:hypothetical protein
LFTKAGKCLEPCLTRVFREVFGVFLIEGGVCVVVFVHVSLVGLL